VPPSVSHALRGRIGGFVTASRYDSRTTTTAARDAFLARFEVQVDPDGALPVGERQRRAVAARRAYFSALAVKSAVARAARRPGGRLAHRTGTDRIG
jgi:hypothetical protein